MPLSESLRNEIQGLVSKNRVVLFMKGNRRAPQCGFSAQVVQILDELLPSYETVDVLRAPELRDGIKEFSDWPTIPQLFIDGQFVGGCDIVRSLHASRELHKLLGASESAPATPTISISEEAAKALAAASEPGSNEALHLQIDAQFQYDLFFGPREGSEIEVKTNGPTLLLDPASARRADGVRIDFVSGPNGGFKIQNPNEPPKVKQIGARELKELLDRGAVTLFDVRPSSERALASILGAHALDPAGQALLESLDRDAPIAFHCHHGVRSQDAASQLLAEGFRNVYNLKGGIEAWSDLVDPLVPHY